MPVETPQSSSLPCVSLSSIFCCWLSHLFSSNPCPDLQCSTGNISHVEPRFYRSEDGSLARITAHQWCLSSHGCPFFVHISIELRCLLELSMVYESIASTGYGRLQFVSFQCVGEPDAVEPHCAASTAVTNTGTNPIRLENGRIKSSKLHKYLIFNW